jgi:hypothetical protein
MTIKNILSILLIIIATTASYGQLDLSKRTLKLGITPKKTNPKPIPIPNENKQEEENIKFESDFLKPKEDKILNSFGDSPKIEKKEKQMFPVRSSAELYANKFNKKEGDISERFKSDTFLGQFSSGTKTVRIACRDHEAPDGDLVRIWLNDRIAVNQILLDVDFTELFLELNEGINKIEFEALNQGESGPNTAQFIVVDASGKTITSNKWNLTTGVKAKIILVKEKETLSKKEN